MRFHLGLDPGPERSALVMVDVHGNPSEAYFAPNAEILSRLEWRSLSCADTDPLAIEGVQSYGRIAGKDVFETCIWIGRFFQAHGNAEIVLPTVWRSHICRAANATSAAIRQALIDRVGPPTTKVWTEPLSKQGKPLKGRWVSQPGPTNGLSVHEWDALGIALWLKDKREGKL